jgi:hypothetical protein
MKGLAEPTRSLPRQYLLDKRKSFQRWRTNSPIAMQQHVAPEHPLAVPSASPAWPLNSKAQQCRNPQHPNHNDKNSNQHKYVENGEIVVVRVCAGLQAGTGP